MENDTLKSKLHQNAADMDRLARQPLRPSPESEAEIHRLSNEIQNLRGQNDRLMVQNKDLMRECDQQKNQKQEWADIYGGMKKEADDLKRDIKYLNGENEKLLIKIEHLDKRGSVMPSSANASSKAAEQELYKKLKKREAECFALWDTLADMRQAGT